MTASAAIHAYGTILQLSNAASPAVYTSILEIRSIGPPGLDRDMIDVTHMESPKRFKEYIGGLIDAADVDLELNYLPANPTHKDMLANLKQTTVANIFRPYRVVFPDFGATHFTFTESGSVLTTGSAHGWNTAQPVSMSSTGTLPVSSPVLIAGLTYWAARASSTTLKLYPTSADAVADTNQITFSGAGSGTHTIRGGTVCTFTGAFKGAKPSGQVAGVLTIAANLKVTGKPVFSP